MTAKNILLIDDESGVLRALSLLLQATGHQVSPFDKPVEALNFISSALPGEIDLVLCDLRMPDYNGFDVLTAIRSTCPDLPFILISGHATREETDKAMKLGANGFLGKPFTPDQLKKVLDSLSEYPSVANE